MMQSKIFKTVLTVAAIVAMAFAAPQPNKPDLSNEIIPSGGFVTKNGNTVSANWGGFQAAASLADDGSVGSASASVNGVGVGSAYAPVDALPGAGGIENGAGNAGVFYGGKPGSDKPGSGKPGSGNHHHQQYQLDGSGINGGGFFDRIFAIPINVLQSVNTYLNQKQQSGTTVHGHPGKPAAPGIVSASVAGSGGPYVDNKEQNAPGPDYGHGKTGGAPMTIPITALRSVQNLLNG